MRIAWIARLCHDFIQWVQAFSSPDASSAKGRALYLLKLMAISGGKCLLFCLHFCLGVVRTTVFVSFFSHLVALAPSLSFPRLSLLVALSIVLKVLFYLQLPPDIFTFENKRTSNHEESGYLGGSLGCCRRRRVCGPISSRD